jgi:hypothetical protein
LRLDHLGCQRHDLPMVTVEEESPVRRHGVGACHGARLQYFRPLSHAHAIDPIALITPSCCGFPADPEDAENLWDRPTTPLEFAS